MWRNPPTATPLTMPSSHRTSSTTAMVYNMGWLPFDWFRSRGRDPQRFPQSDAHGAACRNHDIPVCGFYRDRRTRGGAHHGTDDGAGLVAPDHPARDPADDRAGAHLGGFAGPHSAALHGRLDRADVGLNRMTLTPEDRKSTRLNSSHGYISYAVFCLKKKKNYYTHPDT